MARVVSRSGGTPVLVDASRRMLLAACAELMVQAAFEALPVQGRGVRLGGGRLLAQGLAGPLLRGGGGQEGDRGGREVRSLRPRQAGLVRQGGRPRGIHPRRGSRHRRSHRWEGRPRLRLPLRHIPPHDEERLPLGAARHEVFVGGPEGEAAGGSITACCRA